MLRDADTARQTGDYEPAPPDEAALERLSRLIQLKTVSYNDPSMTDMEEFRKVEKFFKAKILRKPSGFKDSHLKFQAGRKELLRFFI